MGYNKKAYIQTKDSFKAREDRARDEAYMRKAEIESLIPQVREINSLLARTGIDITLEIARGCENIEDRINALRDKNLELQRKRGELLVANGYPADYTQVKFACPKCQDTGFVGTKMCECFRRELIKNSIRISGIGALVDTQSFDSIELKYYADSPENLRKMKNNVEMLKKYAEGFKSSSENLLFMGGTGLGKTHLSTAIARVVIEQGYDVVYDTAQNILGDFEYERFGRGYNTDADERRTDKYFDCDLLIVDDLGTELTNSFTVSSLYNLINTRINMGKPMIINTNLLVKELRERYEDRIASRLMGEFALIMFTGKDIRLQKMM